MDQQSEEGRQRAARSKQSIMMYVCENAIMKPSISNANFLKVKKNKEEEDSVTV